VRRSGAFRPRYVLRRLKQFSGNPVGVVGGALQRTELANRHSIRRRWDKAFSGLIHSQGPAPSAFRYGMRMVRLLRSTQTDRSLMLSVLNIPFSGNRLSALDR
jgi:hypothetical protein